LFFSGENSDLGSSFCSDKGRFYIKGINPLERKNPLEKQEKKRGLVNGDRIRGQNNYNLNKFSQFHPTLGFSFNF
jgi:hypothetical protein